ncbi:tRNA epoxyqueuosine(34) reductase QueG [uncultured Parabacteroides sp.]|uniref:tRNA epoxyqueuosine(34) reductase QueG n=1 Tax=uncultured Parabacteroides sp. TaxID=512312 RepID=UPI00262F4532|nr:tRNA epoxyqueuosine(34) reductase QueG [uncultured Parabacteroides sp.]
MFPATEIKEKAKEIGFDACGIAQVATTDSEAFFFDKWLKEGNHAGMAYMENHREIRLDPTGLVEGAKTVISVALNYYPEQKLRPEAPHIAYYAYGKDYHFVLKEMLNSLWAALLPHTGTGQADAGDARFFTDSAPIFERYWAWKAGLGWIGKNTNLIIPGKGSFFFLGEIVTTLEADQYDTPQKNRCGSCTRCLDACPTGALEGPRHLNARKCLSYLTIENRGEIPAEQAALLGNRLYGCDTCQEVCPWNRFARPTRIEAFRPASALLSLRKEDLKVFSREEYNRIFAKSAVKRAKYEGLIRNIHNLKD